MKTLILYRRDFAQAALAFGDGLSFNDVLDAVGIDTHTMVAGRAIDNEYDSVEIVVHSAKAEV